MSTIRDAVAIFGRIAAHNPIKGRPLSIIYVCGKAFEVPFLKTDERLKKNKKLPKIFIIYRPADTFPEQGIVAVLISPRVHTWRTLQAELVNGTLTHEMIWRYRPALLEPKTF